MDPSTRIGDGQPVEEHADIDFTFQTSPVGFTMYGFTSDGVDLEALRARLARDAG